MALLDFKWFDKVRKAQRDAFTAPDPPVPFNLEDLEDTSVFARLKGWIGHTVMALVIGLARLGPRLRFGRLVIVARKDDVATVLNDATIFRVPYSLEMRELGGADFVLGLDGEAHARLRQIVGPALNDGDIDRVAETALQTAGLLIDASHGKIDVMKDLITRVATECCSEYYGLDVGQPDAFADYTLSISALLFGDPFGGSVARRLALEGAARVRTTAQHAIVRARRRKQGKATRDTVVDRLVATTLSDSDICSALVGLSAGFIPTTTLAAGNILVELLKRPDAMDGAKASASAYLRLRHQARESGLDKDLAAAADARRRLETYLWEAARLNPALQPGQFRFVWPDIPAGDGDEKEHLRATPVYQFRGGWGARTLFPSDIVLAATAAVLQSPRRFDPTRWKSGEMPPGRLMFGEGPHACLGWRLAMRVTAEIFAVLLAQPALRRAEGPDGRLANVGPFPRRLDMTFTPQHGPLEVAMITICAPVKPNQDGDAIRRLIADLGHPAGAMAEAELAATGIIHFASLALIDAGEPGQPLPYLVLELNADGGETDAITRFVEKSGRWLQEIFRYAQGAPDVMSDQDLIALLNRHILELNLSPFGPTGLNFKGTRGASVADIAMQEELTRFATTALELHMRNKGLHAPPMAAIELLRTLLRDPKHPDWSHKALQPWVSRQKALANLLIRPSRQRPDFTAWTPPSNALAVWQVISSYGAVWLKVAGGLVVLALAGAVLLERLTFAGGDIRLLERAFQGGAWLTGLSRTALALLDLIGLLSALLIAVVGATLGLVVVLGAIAAATVAILRWKEDHDPADDRAAPLAKMREIAKIEDHPGFAQNHFMAVTTLKPGFFRRVTLAFGLWAVAILVKHWFRPGFAANLGTIHYAKWFTLPGTGKQIFQANYDGSWESYLEDFIMRNHPGQTAVWSNGMGFPKTRFLFLDGAQDGDRFKRYVRRQQVPTQFWYSRFPKLTTDRIRNNALIQDGLIHALSDTDARAWMSCFGSMPRPDYAIESGEVQSLMFRGMGELPYAKVVLATLPKNPARRRAWLEAMTALPESAGAVDFGDRPGGGRQTATCVAFSAVGLKKLGLTFEDGKPGLATFSAPFNLGMSQRRRVLGDPESDRWEWSDETADAALLIFGKSETACADELKAHEALLDAKLKHLDTAPAFAAKGFEKYEHFGFRDGISQPVIRGSRRYLKGAAERDVVEPGEFIFGYRSNQTYFAPCPVVEAETDPDNLLPMPGGEAPDRFPKFGGAGIPPNVRDFGRNGSFLVIRQLEQKVPEFEEFTRRSAEALQKRYPGLAGVVGARIDADWIAAKLVGRRKDGTPLIDSTTRGAGSAPPSGQPLADGATRPSQPLRDDPGNDFAFGVDDPQGLQCPFGAHIRRANPRDSLEPGDLREQEISNRHRILRRGRSYARGAEKGLAFICLCADLERQFEFVQQTWVGSPYFHGLNNEPDPIVGRGAAPERRFTIPTTSGAVTLDGFKEFVKTKAGGYFFMPSRAAIEYLAALQKPDRSGAFG